MKAKAWMLAAGIAAISFGGVIGVAAAAPEAESKAKNAQRPHDLLVGDKAPALESLEFIKGETVTSFEKGKVYVVEFWATWCGPCITSMPHLSELQQQFANKGVTIIGVTSPDKRNTIEAVKDMVAEKGDGMAYTVAWDPDRKMGEAFMKAAGQNGIPCSFVVDQNGYIAFIGHPLKLDDVLRQVVEKTWDMPKATADYLSGLEMKSQFREFSKLLRSDKNYIAAYATARRMLKGPIWNDADALNMMAWMIVDPSASVEQKDLDLALKAANRADELTEHNHSGTIDTLARVHFLKGDKAKAIELQTKAVALSEVDGNERMTDSMKQALEEYKK